MTCTHYNFPVPEEKMVRVITDTDLCNEADDPFAVVQALLSPKFDNVGVVAAHFGTRDPNGMQKSWQGLKDLTVLMQLTVPVLHGAPHALPDAATPVPSEGAKLIIREAMKEDTRPLFVLLLGPLTDLASAYLQEPRIAGRLTAIWIGGAPYPVGGPEFNLGNDVNAVNVVFGSTMPVWQVPKNVYEMMPVSMAELEYRVRPQGAVGRWPINRRIIDNMATTISKLLSIISCIPLVPFYNLLIYLLKNAPSARSVWGTCVEWSLTERSRSQAPPSCKPSAQHPSRWPTPDLQRIPQSSSGS